MSNNDNFAQMTADEHRAAAQANRDEAAASWERCDTDGFVSQWASGITAQLHSAQARLTDNGGRAEFAALFDLEGNLVPAKLVLGRSFNGMAPKESWLLLATDKPNGPAKKDPATGKTVFHSRSYAATESRQRAHHAKKGFYEGTVLAPARAETFGSGKGLAGASSVSVGYRRTDGGFSRDVVIVDNGQGE